MAPPPNSGPQLDNEVYTQVHDGHYEVQYQNSLCRGYKSVLPVKHGIDILPRGPIMYRSKQYIHGHKQFRHVEMEKSEWLGADQDMQ